MFYLYINHITFLILYKYNTKEGNGGGFGGIRKEILREESLKKRLKAKKKKEKERENKKGLKRRRKERKGKEGGRGRRKRRKKKINK